MWIKGQNEELWNSDYIKRMRVTADAFEVVYVDAKGWTLIAKIPPKDAEAVRGELEQHLQKGRPVFDPMKVVANNQPKSPFKKPGSES